VARAREDLSRVRGGFYGRVAVGLPTSVARVLAVPLTREFKRTMPEATLALSEGLSVAMQESLVNGRLDIALLYGAKPSADVELTHLLDESVFLVTPRSLSKPSKKAAAAQPLPLAELAPLPLIIPTQPNALRNLVESELGALGLQPTIALEIDGVSAILELVADGMGHAVLPQSAVNSTAAMQRFEVRKIEGLESRLSLAISAQRPTTLTQRAMQALIVSLAKPLIMSHKAAPNA
jgi:LysR family transcriptional regulator, nitrogen assimilation regulatory protein